MKVIHTVAATTEAAQAATRPLGLVPTMGYLHDGHLALVRRGRTENATLVVKGGVIMDRRGGCERSGVALQNWTTRRLL